MIETIKLMQLRLAQQQQEQQHADTVVSTSVLLEVQRLPVDAALGDSQNLHSIPLQFYHCSQWQMPEHLLEERERDASQSIPVKPTQADWTALCLDLELP